MIPGLLLCPLLRFRGSRWADLRGTLQQLPRQRARRDFHAPGPQAPGLSASRQGREAALVPEQAALPPQQRLHAGDVLHGGPPGLCGAGAAAARHQARGSRALML